MGKVEYAHQTQNNGQARAEQKQKQAVAQDIQELENKKLHGVLAMESPSLAAHAEGNW